jgi:poly-gamma-glutamate capsule biosynthesis protein CapA/YwtB (metallophosphatase superfamily)
MAPPRTRRAAARLLALVVTFALLAAACDQMPRPSVSPAPLASRPATPALPSPSAAPTPDASASPSTGAPVDFPLAVVTSLTNPKPAITMRELQALAENDGISLPCGTLVVEPAELRRVNDRVGCTSYEGAWDHIAFIPPGLVGPRSKVLPIAGDGPFGSGGPDLFGDAAARALPYPIRGRATGLPIEWTAYDPNAIWTLVSLGGSCLDGFLAYAALEPGHGWRWVMNGGTARYRDVHLNPNPPPGVSREVIVDAVATGNDGAVAALTSGADVTLDDFDCTLRDDWHANMGGNLIYSTNAAALPAMHGKLGIDVMKLAGNHASDFGQAGTRETLRHLADEGVLGVGVGSDLDEALEPAYVDVAGLKVAFVSWNDVSGSYEATPTRGGVAWLRKANVLESVKRARVAGADVVICTPEWWGGAEYHMDVKPEQLRQLGWMDEAGCDQILGHGTHLAGPMILRETSAPGADVVIVSHGNFLFGQSWWQEVQEGVIAELSFRATELANVRLHPYVLVDAARASLTDPEGDGHYVLDRIWKHSDLPAGV